MDSVTLTIPYLPPSPNQTRGQHWARTHRIREDASWAVLKAWDEAGRPPRTSYPATIDVCVHAHGRAGDPDNQWARLKPITDSLVEQGLLVDDSPAWVKLGSMTHEKAPPRKAHLTIQITYQEPA